ncbi:MAG TPA: glycoside hydrolase family 30 beta sandwich domain-containing protein, partial [Acidobacteriaceae bacterium]|nr:glycoside hydrolase family 30 beta sandwich domain-containing protein [Acidobacteriaceae bacterium]
ALDEHGKPNIGPFSCGGTITIENGSHKVTKSGQYWAFAHFSRHVRRGAKVFATSGLAPAPRDAAVTHCGFIHPDGKRVLVIANRGAEEQVQVVMGSQAVDVDLPADSVHTMEWT